MKQRIGKYQILEELGSGAMGIVYKAHDLRIERLVALKVMNPGLLADPAFQQRFEREAKSAGRLQHPNIVTVFDYGEADGCAYIAMEFLEGQSLQDILFSGSPVPLRTKLHWVVQICRGLDHAHSQEVVHRDIKPANIRITPDGRVKIVDFGIARVAGSRLTGTGKVFGSPAFMSPEQARNSKDVDGRADQFAVGVLLFEQLTGQLPFHGEDIYAILLQIINDPHPRLEELWPQAPPGLSEIVDRALAKDPQDRFKTCGEMARQLEEVIRRLQAADIDLQLQDARRLARLGNRSAARKRCEEVLLSDPSHWEALALRDELERGETTGEGVEERLQDEKKQCQASEQQVRTRCAEQNRLIFSKEKAIKGTWPSGEERSSASRNRWWAWFGAAVILCLGVYLLMERQTGGPKGEQPVLLPEPSTTNTPPTVPPTVQAIPATVPSPAKKQATSALGIKFVLIPSGEFLMGSENGENDEKPVHRVRISREFELGKYEVTQGQWQAVMGDNPSYFQGCGKDCPVEQISWNDVQEFIRRLNERKDGYRYGLPTESEWEYACRAGTSGDYGGDLDSMAWYNGNSGSKTHPMRQKRANAWGLYDMHGNVWEWCEDWYGSYSSGYATDPQGPSSGLNRVLRGGGWYYGARDCRSAFRAGISPGESNNSLGFRLGRIRIGSK